MRRVQGPERMLRAPIAGILYAAVVFLAGFVLGTVRVFVLSPGLGETISVSMELPVILAVSWVVCRWIAQAVAVSPRLGSRLFMGLTALTVLLSCEFALSTLIIGRSLAEYASSFATAAGMIGVAGQVAFAAFPVVQSRAACHPSNNGRPRPT